jgi:4'-phosphopantetheinyl transferase EntD
MAMARSRPETDGAGLRARSGRRACYLAAHVVAASALAAMLVARYVGWPGPAGLAVLG